VKQQEKKIEIITSGSAGISSNIFSIQD